MIGRMFRMYPGVYIYIYGIYGGEAQAAIHINRVPAHFANLIFLFVIFFSSYFSYISSSSPYAPLYLSIMVCTFSS